MSCSEEKGKLETIELLRSVRTGTDVLGGLLQIFGQAERALTKNAPANKSLGLCVASSEEKRKLQPIELLRLVRSSIDFVGELLQNIGQPERELTKKALANKSLGLCVASSEEKRKLQPIELLRFVVRIVADILGALVQILGQAERELTKKVLANKSLGLCVANYGDDPSLSFLILSTKADDLFYKQRQFKTQEVKFPDDSKAVNWFGMGCAVSGTDLYLVGGLKIENTSSDSSSDSDSCDYSSKVFRVRFDRLAKFLQTDMEWQKANPTLLEMASPLIIPVGQKLYMLAGPPLSMLPDCPFQVYDPEKDPWKKLVSPPFLDLDSKYFQDPQIRSYVVSENKIHVSTSSFSFTFDTTYEKWDPCTLFDDPKEKARRWIEIQNPTQYAWMMYPPNSNKEYCGRPFEFDGRAVNFELKPHIIICLALFPSREVVAYKFVEEKAPEKQVLLKEKELDIPPDATAYLEDFQDGFLCLLTVSNDHQLKQGCQISITPFTVDKLNSRMSPGNFLKCTPGKKIDYTFAEQSSSKIWTPIGSFVVDL